MSVPSDREGRDERLFELQEHIVELRQSGQVIDPVALAQRFELSAEDVDACLRAADLLADGLDIAPKPPELPAEFELLGELGRGGMGVVYRVHQKPLGRDLALKVLRTAELDDAQSLSRFEHEARALARLRHPNIVGVHSVGRAGSAVYYTMDLVEGRDLGEILRKGPLPQKKAVHLARQVADAVAHAHRQNILHRDLKPGNVLMDPDGNAHVVDFGLARDLSTDRSRHTRTGQLLGTPGSMSPEQAAGDSSALGPATDVHGLGALLYEMLVGRPPFEADSLHELLRAVVENDPPRADAARRSVPRDLATICEHAMARDRAARYPSAEAFADDLRRFAEGQPVAAQPLGLASRTGRRLLREKRLVAVLAFAALFAALAFWLGSTLERADRTLELAESLRARGEARAALACMEATDSEHGSLLDRRRLVQALLDCAEQEPASDEAGDQLARARALIRPHYRITRFVGFGGGSANGRGRMSLHPYRDEDFQRRSETAAQTPPWPVLALRYAFLSGDLEQVRAAPNQFALLGPDLDGVTGWLAAAREDPNDLAHVSALGICLGVLLECERVEDFRDAFPQGDAPQDLLVDLIRVRHRLPAAFAEELDRVVHGVASSWRSFVAPGERALAPLVAFANSPDASTEQRANAAALAAVAMGCAPAGVGRNQPQAVERVMRDWNYWRAPSTSAARRLQARGDLAAWLWQRLPSDDAQEGVVAAWFVLATGCPETGRAAALAWWQSHRDEGLGELLANALPAGERSPSVQQLLDRLGSASGPERRRLHDLLVLRASDRAVPWPGGGPAAAGTVTDPERIAWIHAWLQAFDRATSREVRLRLAWLAFEDGSARPRVVARTSLRGRVGDAHSLIELRHEILPTPGTRLGEFYGSVHSDLLGRVSNGVAIAQKTSVRFLPGSGGAVALVRDESGESNGHSQWGLQGRSSDRSARLAVGDVGALTTIEAAWRRSADRTVELVLMATLEDGLAPDGPWSARTWQARLERALLATPDGVMPSRAAVRAASRIALPTARAVLARLPQGSPDGNPAEQAVIDDEGIDYDYRQDRWLALLLAGAPDVGVDEASVRSIGQRWRGAAFWGRVLRTSDSPASQQIARNLLQKCEPGTAVARTLLATLAEDERVGALAGRLADSTKRDWGVVGGWAFKLFALCIWLVALVRFLTTKAGSIARQQARFALVFGVVIVAVQPAVVVGFALPPAWLWFAAHAGLFQLGQARDERAAWIVRIAGGLLIILAAGTFSGSAGWWTPSGLVFAVLPQLLFIGACFGTIRASQLREPRRAARQAAAARR